MTAHERFRAAICGRSAAVRSMQKTLIYCLWFTKKCRETYVEFNFFSVRLIASLILCQSFLIIFDEAKLCNVMQRISRRQVARGTKSFRRWCIVTLSRSSAWHPSRSPETKIMDLVPAAFIWLGKNLTQNANWSVHTSFLHSNVPRDRPRASAYASRCARVSSHARLLLHVSTLWLHYSILNQYHTLKKYSF